MWWRKKGNSIFIQMNENRILVVVVVIVIFFMKEPETRIKSGGKGINGEKNYFEGIRVCTLERGREDGTARCLNLERGGDLLPLA